MSHWLRGRLGNLICSLQKMREAILNIVPEWEGNIQVSDDGQLSILRRRPYIRWISY